MKEQNAYRIGKALAIVALVWFAVALVHAINRCADALNESNHIMVGVENGQVPPQGVDNFHKADPPHTF